MVSPGFKQGFKQAFNDVIDRSEAARRLIVMQVGCAHGLSRTIRLSNSGRARLRSPAA